MRHQVLGLAYCLSLRDESSLICNSFSFQHFFQMLHQRFRVVLVFLAQNRHLVFLLLVLQERQLFHLVSDLGHLGCDMEMKSCDLADEQLFHHFVVVVAQQILDEQNLDEVLPYFHLLLEHLAVYFLPDVVRRLDLVVLVDEEELKDFQKDYFQVLHHLDLVVLVDEEGLMVLQKDYFQLWQQEQLVVLQEVELAFLLRSL